MTFLPIVERELRVASRRRGTYWNRTLSALVAILVFACILLFSTHEPTKEVGKTLFITLSSLFCFTSLLAGIRYSADCLSEEKREGTLGLLFLTDLRGYDVVLGKLAATSLNAVFGLLAIFPVMAVPLLMGGVTVHEFWRLVLVLVNALFFSLAAGVFVSSISRSARKAMAGTFLLTLLVHGGVPALGAYDAYVRHLTLVNESFLLPSAGYAYYLAFDLSYRTQPDSYLWSVVTTHGLGWLFLALASMAARRSWQDRPAGSFKLLWRERWLRWSYGNAAQRKAFRTRLLDANPCFWLGGRHRLKVMMVWGVLGLLGVVWFWCYLEWPHDWLEGPVYILTAFSLHVVLKMWLASEACQNFGADRRSGALELLLSTPLTVREILHGQMLALRRQFLAPSLAVLAVDFVFMVTGLRTAGSEGDNSWIWFWLAGTTTFAVDMVALAWLGLWIGLTAKRANRATRATVARIMSLPWGTWFFAFLIPGTLNFKLWRPNNEGAFLLGSWFVVSMIISVAFCLWARHRLFHSLREVATQRFTPKASRFDRLFRPLKKNPALPPPIPSET